MGAERTNWVDVDLNGLRKLLERRGKVSAVRELIQNAFDEPITQVVVTLTKPERGRSLLRVVDDSPNGFRDLTQSFTMFADSYKKAEPEKRGAFCLGEKFVLALCEEVLISSTTGTVHFSATGRKLSRVKRNVGTEFSGKLKLTLQEWEEINAEIKLLLPEVSTLYNGVEIPVREPINTFEARLPTVYADEEGQLRRRVRQATVRVYEPLPGETATLFEMGIPVVETGDRWHVSIEQKVPLNMERDNVTPSFLRAVRVAVVNAFGSQLPKEQAKESWVREAASDASIHPEAFEHIIRSRFGNQAVTYDLSDKGSNREASSQDFTVVTGGSLSSGEWENVRRTGALQPAGQLFPTNTGTKTPDKVYSRDEWTPSMEAYDRFVRLVSPALVGHRVQLRFIHDPRIVCGSFWGTGFTVNLAKHNAQDWQANIELMLHELAHTVVQSNDHLNHQFYDTVGRLGAKLALLLVQDAEIATLLKERL